MHVRLKEMPPGSWGTKVQVFSLTYLKDGLKSSERHRSAAVKAALRIINDALSREQAAGFHDHVNHIKTEEMLFAASAYVAHARLSAEERMQRLKIIATVVHNVIGTSENDEEGEPLRNKMFEFIVRASFLYPTVHLETVARDACADELAKNRLLPDSPFQARMEMIRSRVVAAGNSGRDLAMLMNFLQLAIPYMNFAEIEQVAEATATILAAPAEYSHHLDILLHKMGWKINRISRRARARALCEAVGRNIDEYQEILEDICTEVNEARDAKYADLLKVTYQMIDDEVPTPAIAKEQRDLLLQLREKAEAQTLEIVEQVQTSHVQETEEQRELRNAESQRLVAELLASVTDVPQTGATGKQDRREGKMPRDPGPDVPSDPDGREATEAENVPIRSPVDPVAGMKEYLDFQLYELDGLQKRLPTNIEECEQIQASIKAMYDDVEALRTSESTEIADYEALARHADTFLCNTRIRIRELTDRVEEITTFAKALNAARQKERAVYGRSSGGVLRQGLGNLNWRDIAKKYHTRHLGTISAITQGGQRRLLMSDEALALYVTTSSQSGYDFDISCHYWRRRPGRETPPADEQGFMNRDDWYDTYVPCFVLHVPVDG